MSASPLRALTLRQLQFFSVLVEEGQFGRAAKRLSITQPALSNAIKQMEKLLGAELLKRSTHKLELTAVGAEVLARTDFLVNTFDVALRDIESTVQRGRAFVRVGVIPSASPPARLSIRSTRSRSWPSSARTASRCTTTISCRCARALPSAIRS